MLPGLLATFSRKGWLVLLWGVMLLPIGFGLQAFGQLISAALPRWQSLRFLIGVMFDATPEGAEIVDLAAAVLMAIALVPYGLRRVRTRPPFGSNAAVAP